MISNPAPGPKKSHKSAGSDSKNPDPGQHCSLRPILPTIRVALRRIGRSGAKIHMPGA